MKRRVNKPIMRAVLLLAAMLSVVGGCKKKEEAPPPPPKAPKPVQKAVTSAVAALEPSLDFTNRKDPFRPFVVVAPKPSAPAGRRPVREVLLPIQNYDVSQFRVIGIVAGLKDNSAMIVDPTGKGYVVRKGMLIGRNDGRITRITPSGVEVYEQFREDSGKIVKRTIKLTLPRKQ